MADSSPGPYDGDVLRRSLDEVHNRVAAACVRVGRAKDEVSLVAVSKTHPIDAIEVFYEAGVRDFGESYVQEWLDKKTRLPEDIRWHFIGGLQSNKARFVAEEGIALVHSLDRKSLAKQLNRRTQGVTDVLIQLDISGEKSKGGLPPAELIPFFEYVLSLPHLKVRGLMTMPPYTEDPETNRVYFRELKVKHQEILNHCANKGLPHDDIEWLSMGMSNDFEVAVEEGATHIRIGTTLFGERT